MREVPKINHRIFYQFKGTVSRVKKNAESGMIDKMLTLIKKVFETFLVYLYVQ